MKSYEQYGIHFFCVVQYIMNNLDEPWIDKSIDRLCKKTAKMGAKRLHTFLWNGSLKPSERYCKKAIPWKRVDGKVDFSEPNYEFAEALILLDYCAQKHNLDLMLTLFMARYNEDIFKKDKNVQGIDGFYSDEAIEVQKTFARWVIKVMRQYRPGDYKPYVLLMNEPICRGRHEYGANVIAPWHLKMWRAIEDLTTIDHLWVNSGECEYAHCELVGEFKDPWTGKTLGSDEFKSRKVKPEEHGVSTLDSLLEKKFHHSLKSGWKHLVFSEDGARGGSFRVPGLGFWQGNYREVKEMLSYAIRECNKKNKRFYFVSFTMSCLKKNQDTGYFQEDFRRLNHINWKRMKAYKRVARKVKPK